MTFLKDPAFPAIAQKGDAVGRIHRDGELLDESAFVDANEELDDEPASPGIQEDQFHAEWKKTCDSFVKNPESCPHRKNLLVFTGGMEERQAAQAAVEQVFQEVHASLNCILEKCLACAVPVHENICSKMSDLESDLLTLFQRTDESRRRLIQSLEDANDIWQKKYTDFTSRVFTESNHGIEPDAEALDSVNAPGKFSSSKTPEANSSSTVAEKIDQDDLRGEPDWQSMVELNPSSHSNIETYLDGVRKWHGVCDDFIGCYDEIRQAIEISHSNILEILESAYSRLSDKLDGVQIDIQEHIVSNTHRREQIEQALQQVVQQQQSIFSRLMARVGGKAVKDNKGPATESSKGNCLRAMLPFAGMFSPNN